MQDLELFNQPNAEWSGEAYLAITEESIKLLIERVNDHPDCPVHELSDYDAERLARERWMLFQWLDVPMAAFKPYEHLRLTNYGKSRTYRIGDIDISAPRLPVDGVPDGEECFVITLEYW